MIDDELKCELKRVMEDLLRIRRALRMFQTALHFFLIAVVFFLIVGISYMHGLLLVAQVFSALAVCSLVIGFILVVVAIARAKG